MKRLTLLVLSLITLNLYCQEIKDDFYSAKNELSIVVDDIFSKDIYLESDYYLNNLNSIFYDYSLNIVSTTKTGLSYKYHLPASAIRTKLSFGFKNYSQEDETDTSTYKYSLLILQYSLGYERHINLNRTQIFYGADFFYNYTKYQYNSENLYNGQLFTSENNTKSTGYGISPLLGVKYFFTPALSISTEIQFCVESQKGVRTSEYSSSQDIDEYNYEGINTRFGPLGQLSINLHF